MPSEEQMKSLLAGAEIEAFKETQKPDEEGRTKSLVDTLWFAIKATMPGAHIPSTLDEVQTKALEELDLRAWLLKPLSTMVGTNEFESQLPDLFGQSWGKLNWVSELLSAWDLRSTGFTVAIEGYLQRIRNFVRSQSQFSTLTLEQLHTKVIREGSTWKEVDRFPLPFQEQAAYLGYKKDIFDFTFDQLYRWPDLSIILGHYYQTFNYARSTSAGVFREKLPCERQAENWPDYYSRLMTAQSIPPEFHNLILESSQVPLDPATAKMIYLRQRISDQGVPNEKGQSATGNEGQFEDDWWKWYYEILQRNRLSRADAAAVRTVDWLIPPVQDIITMVAKEAFEPDMVATYGLDKEFPIEQSSWLRKIGLSDYWQKKYWAAHWAYPGPQQVLDLLHRGLISSEEVYQYYRVVEIPTYWRDRLIKASYNVYTRVDTRRMHKLGVMNDDQVIRAYLDQGYPLDKAKQMLEFTIAFNLEEERDLTKGELLSIYKTGTITKSSLKDGLRALNYSEKALDMLTAKADYEVDKQKKELAKGDVRRLYIFEVINRSEARMRLDALNITSDGVDLLLAIWTDDREERKMGA